MSKERVAVVQGADMRGFQYALTPYVQKQEWIKESLQRKLSKAQVALAQAQEDLAALQAKLEAQSAQLQQAQLRHPDPIAHQHGLAFLVAVLQSIEMQKETVEQLEKEKKLIQMEYLAQQCKLDGLAEHHDQAQQVFAVEQTRHAASEADREWIGRLKRPPQTVTPVEDVL